MILSKSAGFFMLRARSFLLKVFICKLFLLLISSIKNNIAFILAIEKSFILYKMLYQIIWWQNVEFYKKI